MIYTEKIKHVCTIAPADPTKLIVLTACACGGISFIVIGTKAIACDTCSEIIGDLDEGQRDLKMEMANDR